MGAVRCGNLEAIYVAEAHLTIRQQRGRHAVRCAGRGYFEGRVESRGGSRPRVGGTAPGEVDRKAQLLSLSRRKVSPPLPKLILASALGRLRHSPRHIIGAGRPPGNRLPQPRTTPGVTHAHQARKYPASEGLSLVESRPSGADHRAAGSPATASACQLCSAACASDPYSDDTLELAPAVSRLHASRHGMDFLTNRLLTLNTHLRWRDLHVSRSPESPALPSTAAVPLPSHFVP